MSFSDDFMSVILSMENVMMIFFDEENGCQLVCNKTKLDIDAVSSESWVDLFRDIVFDEDKESFLVFTNKVLHGMRGNEEFVAVSDDRVGVSVRLKKKNDVYSYHNIVCYISKDDDGYIKRMTIVTTEMTAEELYRLQLAQNVTNDRTPTMFIRVANEIVRQHPERKYALIQFDVAKFKAINELYGEPFGDEILNFFIESMNVLCTSEQIFVRLTADVFMVMLTYETEQDLLDFVELVRTNLLGYKNIEYRLVFGIAFVKDVNQKIRKYGDRAALARQSIKSNAVEYVAFYDESMKDNVLSSKYVEDHMTKALENREFVMYLQPKFDMDTESIVGAEALVRWIQPERGVISPAEFIPVFEKNGFVTKLDAYIWEEACKTIRTWLDKNIKPVPISVNMSRAHLKNEKYLNILDGLIEKYDIPKELLEIEMTETVEEDEVAKGIASLKEHGFTLLMDDFGSGYSSLNTLKDTQFDIIKIDREFLKNFVGSDRGKIIVEHTIQMTKSIGLDIVAEGVESLEQAKFLIGSGCKIAQGFYYARPMPVSDFDNMLDENRKK
ncbi:MAG: bifunctional diguanylate cyclase/phosphodiesterase [Clostridium sp.]|nr:bifunctional diguanylate cyclase/phosphodiesterase [Clostridium sp.]MCM1399241.1 bifunctional diguanylate cyclase/phosphodiesterase [Clostridium sp.]MCM1459730.1 bifunctional diguanylate cyclase/phosphodiesterase [Bacteroides sp.]